MSTQDASDRISLPTYGIEILHSRSEVNDIPPEITAHEYIEQLEQHGDTDVAQDVLSAATEISQVVQISRKTADGTLGPLDIFTARQLTDMRDRIKEYLGSDIETHLRNVRQPQGYPLFIGRLATHLVARDYEVTSSLHGFLTRHEEPVANAKGPREENSRASAEAANRLMLKQFETFYQSELTIELTGPVKEAPGKYYVWERGIAECQFLVLDYVRDLLAAGRTNNQAATHTELMTMSDLEHNIRNLILSRRDLIEGVEGINPLLAEQLEQALNVIKDFAVEVVHRGRMGVPRFHREPDPARRAVSRVEMLLVHAASLNQNRADQADIPVLDL